MNDGDRTSIHEAMEQQSISISKAGIVTTLQARCAVIAAANPISGRYDITKTFSENVQLTDPILQRFDILCVLQDVVDPVADERLAKFVVESHIRSHPAAAAAAGAAFSQSQTPSQGGGAASQSGRAAGAGSAPLLAPVDGDSDIAPIPQSLLKKYILHAKTIKPQLTGVDMDKISELYAALRKESEVSNGIPIAVRHIESMIRMAEASARMRLSHYVSDDDVNRAIRVMLESFISAQKFAVMKTLRAQFARYLTIGADANQLLLLKLRQLVKERQALEFVRAGSRGAAALAAAGMGMERVEVSARDLLERAKAHGITDISGFLGSEALRNAGFVYDARRLIIVRDFF